MGSAGALASLQDTLHDAQQIAKRVRMPEVATLASAQAAPEREATRVCAIIAL